jgi:hypothetical protein
MKVYLAGERELYKTDGSGEFNEWTKSVRRRLFSYFYSGAQADNAPHHTVMDTRKFTTDLFLDSGAFSAYTKGATLSVDKYAHFIHAEDIWTTMSNLDDIEGNCQLTYDNQKALESLGCPVCPVFHVRDDVSWLKKYMDEGYEYIFIGGMVIEETKFLHEVLDTLWGDYLTNSDGTPRVKIHGFGLTTPELIIKYPWYSVDSSTWLMTGVFGSCIFDIDGRYVQIPFSVDSPTKHNLQGRHYSTLTTREKSVVDAKLKTIGVTAEECSRHYLFRDVVNAYTFQNMEQHASTHYYKRQYGLFDNV